MIKLLSKDGIAKGLNLYPKSGSSIKLLAYVEDKIDCCCEEECEATWFGLKSPEENGWAGSGIKWNPEIRQYTVKSKFPFTCTFTIEASISCNGSNGGVQGGKLTCSFVLKEARSVTYKVNGDVETQNPGYDEGKINFEGKNVSIISDKNGGQCQMEAKSDEKTVELAAGKHIFSLEVDTIDGQWHPATTYYFAIY
jgi:hypothetical protein